MNERDLKLIELLRLYEIYRRKTSHILPKNISKIGLQKNTLFIEKS